MWFALIPTLLSLGSRLIGFGQTSLSLSGAALGGLAALLGEFLRALSSPVVALLFGAVLGASGATFYVYNPRPAKFENFKAATIKTANARADKAIAAAKAALPACRVPAAKGWFK